jgi:hypothetical protein
MLHLAGSLKLGPVQAMSVMRTIQIGDKPTKLAQAAAEMGRIDKTIHALTFIDDENKRRRTLTQLNRGEERHTLGRAVSQGNVVNCGSAIGKVRRVPSANVRDSTRYRPDASHAQSARTSMKRFKHAHSTGRI